MEKQVQHDREMSFQTNEMSAGLTEEDAVKSLTIEGAKMLELEDRIGSLEKGKDAYFWLI